MVFCPRLKCGTRVISEQDSNLAQCTQCGFPFCKLCKQTWHGPGTCPAIEKVHPTLSSIVCSVLTSCSQDYYIIIEKSDVADLLYSLSQQTTKLKQVKLQILITLHSHKLTKRELRI